MNHISDDDREDVDDDPDAVRPEVIDRILERELSKREISPDRTPTATRTKSYLYRYTVLLYPGYCKHGNFCISTILPFL